MHLQIASRHISVGFSAVAQTRLARPGQGEAGAAQSLAAADGSPAAMPVDDPPDDGQSQAMPAGSTGPAIVQA